MIALAVFIVALAVVIVVLHTFWWIAAACAVALAAWAGWTAWDSRAERRTLGMFHRHLEDTGAIYRSATAAHARTWAASRRASRRLRGW